MGKKLKEEWISNKSPLNRDRFCYTVLASTDEVFFAQDGKEGKAVVLDRKSHKNGKWSTSASLVMFDGEIYKSCSFSHDFETGRITTRHYSLSAMKEDFNMPHVSHKAFLSFLKESFPIYLERYNKKREEILKFEDSSESSGSYEYYFHHEYNSRRLGHTFLVVTDKEGNESVWGMKENSDKRIVILERNDYSGHGGGGTEFKLLVDSSLNLEELTYGGFGNDDCLEQRGYIWDDESQSYKKSNNNVIEGNTPMADLLKGIKL